MVRFGVARKYAKDLNTYLDRLKVNNIDAFEMGFAYGVPVEFPNEFIEKAKQKDIVLNGHLPFWINFGNINNNEKNIKYLTDGMKIAEILGATVVFHLGFYGDNDFNNLKNNIVYCFHEALNIVPLIKGRIGIETTGKQKAIGTIDEIIWLINTLHNNRIIPIIDWSHVFARSNGNKANCYSEFKEILLLFEKNCYQKANYFHGGGVEFKDGNERKHISAKSMKPPIPELLQVLRELDYDNFTFIVESPDSINDVNWLKEIWYQNKDSESGVILSV